MYQSGINDQVVVGDSSFLVSELDMLLEILKTGFNKSVMIIKQSLIDDMFIVKKSLKLVWNKVNGRQKVLENKLKSA